MDLIPAGNPGSKTTPPASSTTNETTRPTRRPFSLYATSFSSNKNFIFCLYFFLTVLTFYKKTTKTQAKTATTNKTALFYYLTPCFFYLTHKQQHRILDFLTYLTNLTNQKLCVSNKKNIKRILFDPFYASNASNFDFMRQIFLRVCACFSCVFLFVCIFLIFFDIFFLTLFFICFIIRPYQKRKTAGQQVKT